MLLFEPTISTYAYSTVTFLTNNSSAPVHSSQTQVHPGLVRVVRRHHQSLWQLKPHQPTLMAFNLLQQLLSSEAGRPLILDSGCGNGQSTLGIAAEHPESLVIGIDQSAKRLQRTGASSFPHQQGNVIWIRAELANFWWLANQAGWKLSKHYLLYPNPWPKPSQLSRRWHGHPVFPSLLALGGALELRCNWEIYAQEFAFALKEMRGIQATVNSLQPNEAISPFEKKYRDSGLPLFQVKAQLD
jgi:tRNA G46 methylase TrmB